MKRIIIQLDEADLRELDAEAKSERTSRAAFVREAVLQAIAERRRKRELQEIVDSYAEKPQEADLIPPLEAIRQAWPE